MNKPLLFILLILMALLSLVLAACDAPPARVDTDVLTAGAGETAAVQEPAPEPTVEPEYIWTVSVDGVESRSYGDGQLNASYTVHISASKEGGSSPLGEYRGELRVEYEGEPDAATVYAIELLGGSYDFEGWGENDALAFTMEPYDHAAMMQFVADAYMGEGARTAPLIDGIAMCTAQDIPWTQSDWAMGLEAGLAGVFGVSAGGDEAGASSSVYTPFGSGSANRDEAIPLMCSLHFLDEGRVQFNIWSHGGLDVNLSFNGSLDKIPLADTSRVG